ncbi:MAG: elongation factor G [Myxococcales bacterium]|nr:elongation factor G [Myxococcales bacterium]
MHTQAIEQIRNLGIMAHIDAGKTTTTERILYYSGVSSRMGEVHHGASVMDWMEQEQERGISITAASTSFQWALDDGKLHHCNLIDTPGHIDFTIEVERSLRVLDGAIAVFCAVSGVEPQSETVWRQADRYDVPRIAFINKCDRIGADPAHVAEDLRRRLNANPIVLQLPHTLEDGFNGIVDLVHFRSRVWEESSLGQSYRDIEVPEELREEGLLARGIMLEALAEVDDVIMEKYLAEVEISPADIVAALRRATLGMRAVPVLMGAALKNRGIQNLLDAVISYLPSPIDVGAVGGLDPKTGGKLARMPSEQEPLTALAFKVMTDPKVGQVTYLRVYSGVLRSTEQLLNASQDKREKLGRLVRMHASYREEVKELAAGDIGAAVGLRVTTTGDTLCDPGAPIALQQMHIPRPVASVVLEPETEHDHGRLRESLVAIAAEDPSVTVDSQGGQTVLRGMGELHLEVVVDRLAREFGVKARAGRPQVAYRETVSAIGENQYLLERAAPPTDGDAAFHSMGQYAGVRLRVEPTAGPEALRFESDLPSDFPRAFLSAIESGVVEAAKTGPIASFPMVDLKVTVLEANLHPVDSSEMAFNIAALRCFSDAALAAKPTLLEPVMELEVVVPDDHVGDVVGDLHARRGKIAGIEARHGVQVIACLVPLSKMFGYSTDLRSRTQGRATYSMQLKNYNEVPTSIKEDVVARVRGT